MWQIKKKNTDVIFLWGELQLFEVGLVWSTNTKSNMQSGSEIRSSKFSKSLSSFHLIEFLLSTLIFDCCDSAILNLKYTKISAI